MLIKDGIGEEMIISIGAEPTDSIEDLFSTADQERFGLKSKSISKTITSKLFQEKIIQDSEPLSTETEDNFKELFNKIEQSLVNNCK
ncbi:hypothetical protein EI28_12730 [Methanoculleus sp. MH98A]|nr:hypothetical protein EI28_12730 [Methanoculleus sp. MH98A]